MVRPKSGRHASSAYMDRIRRAAVLPYLLASLLLALPALLLRQVESRIAEGPPREHFPHASCVVSTLSGGAWPRCTTSSRSGPALVRSGSAFSGLRPHSLSAGPGRVHQGHLGVVDLVQPALGQRLSQCHRAARASRSEQNARVYPSVRLRLRRRFAAAGHAWTRSGALIEMPFPGHIEMPLRSGGRLIPKARRSCVPSSRGSMTAKLIGRRCFALSVTAHSSDADHRFHAFRSPVGAKRCGSVTIARSSSPLQAAPPPRRRRSGAARALGAPGSCRPRRPVEHPLSRILMVEAAGIEPASAGTPPSALHA